MILSMTGYGKAVCNLNNTKIAIEIKSLNSKTADVYTKIPIRYKTRELELRKLLSDSLERGKIELFLNIENSIDDSLNKLNKNLVNSYIKELESIAEGTKLDYLKMAVRMPDVFSTDEEDVSEDEWNTIFTCTKEAIKHLLSFRKEEGTSLEKEFKLLTNNILNLLNSIEEYEKERIEKVKQKLTSQLNELEVKVDEQRYHQELVYYIEKLDISEEKLRLKQHCDYFLNIMEENTSNGKKLGFISQEMGREINTIGSKASHSEIQKIVVLMKDELEKIKEQTNNVL